MRPFGTTLVLGSVIFVLGPSAASAQLVRVSISSAGVPANAPAITPALSGDGRFVAYVTASTNLVPGDTNADLDVFLHDRDADADGIFDEAGAIATIRASARPGVEANGASFDPVLTPDGRYVVFTSRAANLVVPGQPALPYTIVYRFDRLTGDVRLVSASASGAMADSLCLGPSVTDDGRYVVFVTHATNLLDEGIGFGGVVLLKDMETGAVTRISDSQPPPGMFHSFVESPSISGDGRRIAFALVGRHPTTGAVLTGSAIDVDRQTGTRRVRDGWRPALSYDGHTLVFAQGFTPGRLVSEHLPSGERRLGPDLIASDVGYDSISPSGRYVQVAGALFVDFRYSSFIGYFLSRSRTAFDRNDRVMAIATQLDLQRFGVTDIAVTAIDQAFDTDTDGINDHWESFFRPPNGPSDAPGDDPDGDGRTNLQEFQAGSHPRGTHARYLAEGATGAFFETRLAIANPAASPVSAVVRFERPDGSHVVQLRTIPPRSRITVSSTAESLLGIADFATVVESDGLLVVDRLMSWGAGAYGSHAETSAAAPSTTWLLAEGTTVVDTQLFYLLQNPQPTPTQATVRFLRPSGPPLVRTYDLAARSRTTIHVNAVPALGATDVSAEITATQPIAVERAMYRNQPGQVFALGHAAAGVAQSNTSWFLAEGATGSFFDTYVLVVNPSAQPASVQVDFLRDGGTVVSRTYAVAASSRFSVYVDGVPGMEATTFGARVTSTVPIVVERAMYWAGGFYDYYEGHVSAATTQTGSHWVLAEGEVGGPRGAETYILIANTGSAATTVNVRALRELDGTLPPGTPASLTVPAGGRISVPLSGLVPEAGRYGVDVLEPANPTGALVVEGALYWNAGGQLWGAGASWPATRVP